MRSKGLARTVAGAAVVASVLGAPASAWAAHGQGAASAKEPSQSQLQGLDKVAKKHSALGVFGADGDSDPVVLTMPAGTTADEKAKAVADIPDGMNATVKISRFAEGEASKKQKEIQAGKWHKDANKYGLSSFYDGETDKVIVNTEAPENIRTSLKSHFGSKVEVVQSRFEQQATRFNDGAPYYGGSSIHTDKWGSCTSGFKIHAVNPETRQDAYMMTTAGHCYTLNELVRNRNNNWMGWVKRFGEADIEAFVGYDYARSIWTGGTADSTSSLLVNSLSGMYNGLHVCVSGQTSFNHCGHPITSTQYAFNWSDHNGHTHHTNSWDGFSYGRGGTNYPRYDNGKITQGGDSGAPVYVPSGPYTAAASGSHSGIVWWNCDACTGHTEYRMYGVKAQFVHDSWGGGITTS